MVMKRSLKSTEFGEARMSVDIVEQMGKSGWTANIVGKYYQLNWGEFRTDIVNQNEQDLWLAATSDYMNDGGKFPHNIYFNAEFFREGDDYSDEVVATAVYGDCI